MVACKIHINSTFSVSPKSQVHMEEDIKAMLAIEKHGLKF